jgi:hypothetical protein
MVAAAGEYYDRPDISTADVTDPKIPGMAQKS